MHQRFKCHVVCGWVGAALLAVAGSALAQETALREGVDYRIESRRIEAASSIALRDIKPIPVAGKSPKVQIPNHLRREVPGDTPEFDAALQTAPIPGAMAPTLMTSFPGLGEGDYGYNVNVAPPDTVGEAGTTQYVQWVNVSLAIFDKATGGLISGPIAGNQLFTGLGGPCATNNSGDPMVLFDQKNQRWVLSQFAVSGPYYQCVAVSKTADATGEYWLYALPQPNFNDYPKMGVWGDGYYFTYNMFNGTTFAFVGARVCALDSSKMILGQAVSEVCVQLSSSYYSLMPSDVDGNSFPAAGTPNYIVDIRNTTTLDIFKFLPNFASPSSSSFTGPTALSVASFITACGGGNCIKQPQTSTKLDSLSSMIMYRNAYRELGGNKSLVFTHSVGTDRRSRSTGLRWYELRVGSSGNPAVYQYGTYAPSSDYRWMGSAAMDKLGNIGLGYSVSSSSRFPSIAVSGRVPTDPLGSMGTETFVVNGSGSQTSNLTRWGDYSALTIDPVDDCTFWYTTEYAKTNGSFNWGTYIASFKLPGC